MLHGMAVSHPEQCQRTRKRSDNPRPAFSPTGSECRWHCSRAPMGSNVRVGGVDEPARSTDVFYGLALSLDPRCLLILARERQRNANRRVHARLDYSNMRSQKVCHRRGYSWQG